MIVWDSVYFNDLFINPIQFEHQFVFVLVDSINQIVEYQNYYTAQLTSILISNLCHFASVITLYYLTNEMDMKFGLVSGLLMIISPAGCFDWKL